MSQQGRIRCGVGGWTFPPWRGVFYPDGLSQKNELAYMAGRLTAIEINATYYGSQKPENFRKWASETPEDFMFTVKGSRFCTNRKVLTEGRESVERFLSSGITELGAKLGPLLWQFANTKKFDEADMRGFLELLPERQDGLALRHALEVRHDSFIDPAFVALAREFGCAIVYAKHHVYPEIADVTADFVYARLQTGSDDVETAYPPDEIAAWAGRLETWAAGGAPADLPLLAEKPKPQPRDVFCFIIHEGKVRAPAGAQALIANLGPEHRAST
ncbi:MAG: DUF72 domain-containing protein [Caulobacteraceae bacterium]